MHIKYYAHFYKIGIKLNKLYIYYSFGSYLKRTQVIHSHYEEYIN